MFRRELWAPCLARFVVHGQLLSLQRPKTNRLPKPADRVPLRVCQRFCLWTGYHLAPRAIPWRRGPCSQFPAESPICRPWKNNEQETKRKEGGTVIFIVLFQ